jgi:hypothetical protein
MARARHAIEEQRFDVFAQAERAARAGGQRIDHPPL